MGVHSFLKSALKSSMKTMDAEPIKILGYEIDAVLNETSSKQEVGVGAKINERTLTAQFPTPEWSKQIKSGAPVVARGEKWQVSSDDDAVKIHQSSTIITLVEPERRAEF